VVSPSLPFLSRPASSFWFPSLAATAEERAEACALSVVALVQLRARTFKYAPTACLRLQNFTSALVCRFLVPLLFTILIAFYKTFVIECQATVQKYRQDCLPASPNDHCVFCFLRVDNPSRHGHHRREIPPLQVPQPAPSPPGFEPFSRKGAHGEESTATPRQQVNRIVYNEHCDTTQIRKQESDRVQGRSGRQ
jgi:hypothetical protein